jgi:hypothetical protein
MRNGKANCKYLGTEGKSKFAKEFLNSGFEEG